MSLAGYGIGERSKAGIKEKNGSDLATTANPPTGGCYGSGSKHPRTSDDISSS